LLGPAGVALGAVNSISGLLGGPTAASMMGVGDKASTARDSNTPDSTGTTGGNAGATSSSASSANGNSSNGGFGGGYGGGGGGDYSGTPSNDAGLAKAVAPLTAPPVAPTAPYVGQTMGYQDLGASKSIINPNIYNPIYMQQPYAKGGRISGNNSQSNATRLAHLIHQEMRSDPLFDRKIQSILSRL
jgi:hypothetical protein